MKSNLKAEDRLWDHGWVEGAQGNQGVRMVGTTLGAGHICNFVE